MVQDSAVFWSYARLDDKNDQGRIQELAEHVKNAYCLITGDDLILFLDSESIAWGEAWRARIENALNSSTFFIPLLTPTYFKRKECRREFMEFYTQAQSRNVLKLMLPITYLKVPNFNEQNRDEHVAAASRVQCIDFSEIRLKDSTSSDYRLAVNGIAARLAELREDIQKFESSVKQFNSGGNEDPDLGLMDRVKIIETLLPEWLEAVEEDQITYAQYVATQDAYILRLNRLTPSSGMAGRKLAVYHRMATDLLPLAKLSLESAQVYSRQTINLQPHVKASLRLAKSSPENLHLLDHLRAGVQEAKLGIEKQQRNQADPNMVEGGVYWGEKAALGKVFRELAEVHDQETSLVLEANRVVGEWGEELDKLFE